MKSDDPHISMWLMNLTYVVGGIGLAIGYSTVNDVPASLSLAALLAVGGSGVLSWLRHSVFHRSDAKRMGWDLGQRNNFQIEVGIANLAWGALAILAVIFDWGIAAEAASLIVFGVYLVGVATMLAVSRQEGAARPWVNVIVMLVFGVGTTVLGILGMSA